MPYLAASMLSACSNIQVCEGEHAQYCQSVTDHGEHHICFTAVMCNVKLLLVVHS